MCVCVCVFILSLDVDECAAGTDNCDATNATCTNTDGSFTCACNSGWESADNGVTCTGECMFVCLFCH